MTGIAQFVAVLVNDAADQMEVGDQQAVDDEVDHRHGKQGRHEAVDQRGDNALHQQSGEKEADQEVIRVADARGDHQPGDRIQRARDAFFQGEDHHHRRHCERQHESEHELGDDAVVQAEKIEQALDNDQQQYGIDADRIAHVQRDFRRAVVAVCAETQHLEGAYLNSAAHTTRSRNSPTPGRYASRWARASATMVESAAGCSA